MWSDNLLFEGNGAACSGAGPCVACTAALGFTPQAIEHEATMSKHGADEPPYVSQLIARWWAADEAWFREWQQNESGAEDAEHRKQILHEYRTATKDLAKAAAAGSLLDDDGTRLLFTYAHGLKNAHVDPTVTPHVIRDPWVDPDEELRRECWALVRVLQAKCGGLPDSLDALLRELGAPEREILRRLRGTDRLRTKALLEGKIPKRALERLKDMRLIEACGSGQKTKRGVYRLTQKGREVATRMAIMEGRADQKAP